nr:unnamed protein product [Digitaria exilis]
MKGGKRAAASMPKTHGWQRLSRAAAATAANHPSSVAALESHGRRPPARQLLARVVCRGRSPAR